MRQFSGEDSRETILQQELLLALEGLARQRPALLQGTLTFQLGQLLLLLTSELASERKLGSAEAFEALCALPPHGIFGVWGWCWLISPGLGRPCSAASSCTYAAKRCGKPRACGGETHRWLLAAAPGAPRGVAVGAAQFLSRCVGAAAALPRAVDWRQVERRNRLDSALLAEKTPDEQNFAVLVEHLLSKIEAPEYRQLSIEACCR